MTCAAFAVLSYLHALLGPIIILLLYLCRRLQLYLVVCYIWGSCLCAVGWEIWWTFGIFGDSVEKRRDDCANKSIPMWINWALNSSTDGGWIYFVSIFLSWLSVGRDSSRFSQFDWRVWLVFVVWGFGQQVFVTWSSQDDLKGQGGEGDVGFGWAPLAPIPSHATLFKLGSSSFSVQVMQPWIIAPHLLFISLVYIHRRFGGIAIGGQRKEAEGASVESTSFIPDDDQEAVDPLSILPSHRRLNSTGTAEWHNDSNRNSCAS